MSYPRFVADQEMKELLVGLGTDKRFVRLMELMEQRCDNLAVWAHLLKDDVQLRWASGRVQEMTDWLAEYNKRHDKKSQTEPEVPNEF